jgi:hypothetical protein
MKATFTEWMNTINIYQYTTIADLKEAYNYYLSNF